MTTAEDIRTAFGMRYPDVDDDQFSIEHSGFAHENPLTAIGIVLISSAVLGTTDVDRLAGFTKYGREFIRVIACNMENSRLWRDGKYHCAWWSCGNLLPRGENGDSEFWDHIQIAEGSMWTAEAEPLLRHDAGAVFYNLKLVN
jgi:hypothetical protein